MTTGIYKLNFTGTDKVYIGKGKSIEGRLCDHLRNLRNKEHSKKMNSAYAEFGMPTLEVLCECLESELNEFENETIEIYDSVDNGFNTLYCAEDMPTGGPSGDLNGKSKYSNSKIIEVFNLLVSRLSLKEVVTLTNVSYDVVSDVSSGVRHSWLAEEFPEKYATMLSYVGNRRLASMRGVVYLKLLSPVGIVYTVENIRAFAREHELSASALCSVLNGKHIQHKGWKLAIN